MLSKAQHNQRVSAAKSRGKQIAADKAHQRRAQAGRSHQSLSDAGRNGYRVAVQHGFREKALQGIKEYQAKHPSRDILRAMHLLDALEVNYERDAILDGFIVDLVNRDLMIAIEVNGGVHDVWDVSARAETQRRKLESLKRQGFTCLVLDYKEIDQWGEQLSNLVNESRTRQPQTLWTEPIPF